MLTGLTERRRQKIDKETIFSANHICDCRRRWWTGGEGPRGVRDPRRETNVICGAVGGVERDSVHRVPGTGIRTGRAPEVPCADLRVEVFPGHPVSDWGRRPGDRGAVEDKPYHHEQPPPHSLHTAAQLTRELLQFDCAAM